MKKAEMLLPNGTWTLVSAADLTDKDRHKIFRCPICHALAYLNISHVDGKDNWFASNEHVPRCGNAEGGKTFKTVDGHEFKLRDALAHKDKPIQPPTPKPPINPEGDPEEEPPVMPEPEDNMTINERSALRVCGTMYSELCNMRADDVIMEGFPVRDFIIDSRSIEAVRNEGIQGQMMIVCRRCAVNAMNPPIPKKEGYVVLRDAYTQNDADAIYVYVKVDEATHAKLFKTQLFGDKKENVARDPHRYIVLFGRFTPVNNADYSLYEITPLSSARYKFTNYRR